MKQSKGLDGNLKSEHKKKTQIKDKFYIDTIIVVVEEEEVVCLFYVSASRKRICIAVFWKRFRIFSHLFQRYIGLGVV